MTRPGPRRRGYFRSREQSVIGTGFGVFFFVMVLSMAAAGTLPSGIAIAFAAVALAGAFGLIRAARSGIKVSQSRVTVRNPFRTVTVELAEVDRCFLDVPYYSSTCASLHLLSGGRVLIWGIQSPNERARPKNRSAHALVDAVNEALSAARAA